MIVAEGVPMQTGKVINKSVKVSNLSGPPVLCKYDKDQQHIVEEWSLVDIKGETMSGSERKMFQAPTMKDYH